MFHFGPRTERCRSGFTIIEVLIALTASLLLMLGLARAYKLLGDRITERQSELDLSSRLRDVAVRLRDELRRCTSNLNPPASEGGSEGYFVYHEGPFTDSTTILGSVPNPTPVATKYFPDSQFGDIDDYLAFTARAEPGAPYVGFVPRGVIDARRFANGQMNPTDRSNYDNNIASSVVPIYSSVAEIAYWLSPTWERNPDGSLVYEDQNSDSSGAFSLHPIYKDRNEDMLPDRLSLHRRTLLVRPDLNMSQAEMHVANNRYGSVSLPSAIPTDWDVPTVPFLIRNGAGNLQVVPISRLNGSNQSYFPNAGYVNAPGVWYDGANASGTAAPNWLAGMARMHQVMDLSIGRVTDSWSTPATGPTTPPPTFGMPTALVHANSLSDLSRPENRFAHVRIPQQIINGQQGSSFAQLALAPPHPYLIARSKSPPDLPGNSPLEVDGQTPAQTPTTFPTQADHVLGSAPGGTNYLNEYGRFTLKTFLRPEFNLVDRVSDFGAGGNAITLVNRAGTDIIAEDVVAFNVQIFDPSAPIFAWTGRDGVPGSANQAAAADPADDDANGIPNDASELGWPGTDDEIVTVNDPRIDEVLVNNGSRSSTDWFIDSSEGTETPFFVVDRGDFVDLGYARLAGGPMRGLRQFDEQGNLIPPAPRTPRYGDFASTFSGYSPNPSVMNGTISINSTFPVSWEQSGRFILSSNGGSRALSSFYQPIYDTWADGYRSDRYDQEGVAHGSVSGANFGLEIGGVTPNISAYRELRVPQENNASPNNMPEQRRVVMRRWSSFDGANANEGEFVGQNAGGAQTPSRFSATAHRVSAPIPDPLRAIKISIRINDLGAETIRQQTVIQEF